MSTIRSVSSYQHTYQRSVQLSKQPLAAAAKQVYTPDRMILTKALNAQKFPAKNYINPQPQFNLSPQTSQRGLIPQHDLNQHPILEAPFYGGRSPTFREKLGHMWRTTYFSLRGLVYREKLPNPDTHLHKKWQKVLHKILPGETIMAPMARMKRTAAEKAIPVSPETRIIDPRQFMPNIVFGKGENSFPVSADFDNDRNVNNNAFTYEHGRFTGNQQPTAYMHSVKKGQYTVLIYHLYFADNLYSNYHNHDWQPFEIYMKQNKKGQWQPEFLMTHWHHGKHMERWEDLKLDINGRPFIKVERGAHAIWPYTKDQSIKKNDGWTMRHDGLFQNRKSGQSIRSQVRFISEDNNFIGTDKPANVPGGYTTMNYPYYLKDEFVMGFFRTGKAPDLWKGPSHPSQERYYNPMHPRAFFKDAPI